MEKRRLVRGYILSKNPESDTPEENRIKSEELIRKRKEFHGRTKR